MTNTQLAESLNVALTFALTPASPLNPSPLPSGIILRRWWIPRPWVELYTYLYLLCVTVCYNMLHPTNLHSYISMRWNFRVDREDLIRASKGVGLYLISTWQQLQYSRYSTGSLFYDDQVVMSHSRQGERLNMVSKPKHCPVGGLANWRWTKDIPLALSRLAGGFMERSTLLVWR